MQGCPVLITAGGTVEPIDDVRAITNFSKGGVGLALAEEACVRGLSVTFFMTPTVRGEPPAGVEVVPVTNAANLASVLLPRVEAFSNGPGVIVFHAAAVADYAPVRTDGKISSDQEELTITLRRNPKIVDQIKPLGRNNVTLCSFKLLSRKDARDVRDVARVQLIRTGSDLVVANYVEDVFAGQYLGWICLPNGEDIVVSSRAELARRALEIALRPPLPTPPRLTRPSHRQ